MSQIDIDRNFKNQDVLGTKSFGEKLAKFSYEMQRKHKKSVANKHQSLIKTRAYGSAVQTKKAHPLFSAKKNKNYNTPQAIVSGQHSFLIYESTSVEA